jgi:FtsH-binding integral membrane protein
VNSGTESQDTPIPAGALLPEDRRWLHDKFERLEAEEGQLAAGRTSYFAAVCTVLITAIVVAVADLSGNPLGLTLFITFLSVIGVLITFVWAVLLHRTNDAHTLWKEANLRLEQLSPPIPGSVTIPITLRSGSTLPANLLRPYETHAARFSKSRAVSWMDRVDPERLTEILPVTFLVIWASSLVVVWVWYLVLR